METEHLDESTDFIPMEDTSETHIENIIPMKGTAETHNEDSPVIANLNAKEDISEFDLGVWVNKSLTTEQKSQILKRCWVPPESYDFNADSSDPKRRFIHSWLQIYKPWLVYSKKLKGALCLYCVLFHQNVVKGVLGVFIVSPFTKYKDMHDTCKNHAISQWHQASMKAAISFDTAIPVDVQMISGHQKLIEENKKIIRSIISNVIFCGTTDSPLRGKDGNSGKIFRTIES